MSMTTPVLENKYIFIDPVLCNFVRLKTSDKLSVNIGLVLYIVIYQLNILDMLYVIVDEKINKDSINIFSS